MPKRHEAFKVAKRSGSLRLFLLLAFIYAAGTATPLLYRQWNTPALQQGEGANGRMKLLGQADETPLNARTLQQRIQELDATHVVRKYHQHYALFNIADLWREKEVIQVAQMDDPSAYIQEMEKTLDGDSNISFNEEALGWTRISYAQPVDALRLTFRGNGIPKNISKLAQNPLLEPKLLAFYHAITQPNTTIWKGKETVRFNVVTFDDKIYQAQSTPFIAIQKISKSDLAKMQSAALPFLWKAYSGTPLDVMKPPRRATKEARKDVLEESSLAYVLNRLAPAAGIGNETKDAASSFKHISGFSLDEKALEELYYEQLLSQIKNSEEKKNLINYLFDRHKSKELFTSNDRDNHIDGLANYDSEFSALFIVNNLFEQYNVFSAFKEGVSLRINAIDTRLNTVYLSYDVVFDHVSNPPFTPVAAGKNLGCGGKDIKISNEFLLITAKPHSYLIQIYLPDCHMTENAYEQVNNFLNSIRITNTAKPL